MLVNNYLSHQHSWGFQLSKTVYQRLAQLLAQVQKSNMCYRLTTKPRPQQCCCAKAQRTGIYFYPYCWSTTEQHSPNLSKQGRQTSGNSPHLKSDLEMFSNTVNGSQHASKLRGMVSFLPFARCHSQLLSSFLLPVQPSL